MEGLDGVDDDGCIELGWFCWEQSHFPDGCEQFDSIDELHQEVKFLLIF